MPVESLLGNALAFGQNAVPDFTKGIQIAQQVAHQKIQLENDQQLLEIRKQQNEADKDDKLFKTFRSALMTDDPTEQKFWRQSLARQAQVFGRPIDEETVQAIIQAPTVRKDLIKSLSALDLTNSVDKTKAIQLFQQITGKPFEDAVPIINSLAAQPVELKKAKLQGELFSGRMAGETVAAALKKLGDKGAFSQLEPRDQMVLGRWIANPAGLAAVVNKDPGGIEAVALQNLALTGSKTAEVKANVDLENKRAMITNREDAIKVRHQRLSIAIQGLSLRQQQQVWNVVNSNLTALRPMDNLLANEEVTRQLIESGAPLNKLTAGEAMAGLQRLYQGGNGTLTEGRRQALELNTVQSFINNQLSKLDPSQPIPEDIQQIYRSTYKRAYQAYVEGRDTRFQRGISTGMGVIPNLRPYAQGVVDTYKMSDAQFPTVFGKPASGPIRQKKVFDPNEDVGAYIPKFAGATYAQLEKAANAEPNGPKKLLLLKKLQELRLKMSEPQK